MNTLSAEFSFFIISAQCVLHIQQQSYEMYRICDLD